jgi:hypothetical protein
MDALAIGTSSHSAKSVSSAAPSSSSTMARIAPADDHGAWARSAFSEASNASECRSGTRPST